MCINKHFYFSHNTSQTNLYAASECKFCSTNQKYKYVGQHQKREYTLCTATVCKMCFAEVLTQQLLKRAYGIISVWAFYAQNNLRVTSVKHKISTTTHTQTGDGFK